jgi:hypothetical protein
MSLSDQWIVVQMASPDPATWQVMDDGFAWRRKARAVNRASAHAQAGLVGVQAITVRDYLARYASTVRHYYRDQGHTAPPTGGMPSRWEGTDDTGPIATTDDAPLPDFELEIGPLRGGKRAEKAAAAVAARHDDDLLWITTMRCGGHGCGWLAEYAHSSPSYGIMPPGVCPMCGTTNPAWRVIRFQSERRDPGP